MATYKNRDTLKTVPFRLHLRFIMISLRFLLLAGFISMTVSLGSQRRSGPSPGPAPPPSARRGIPPARRGPPPGRRGPPPQGPPPGSPSSVGSEEPCRPEGPGGPEEPGGPEAPGGPEEPGGPEGPGGPGECFMSPACKTFSRALQEEMLAMHERGEGGPENCPDENHEVCRWNDMMKARCKVKEEVAAECLQEMNMFMNGECPAINEASADESTTSWNP